MIDLPVQQRAKTGRFRDWYVVGVDTETTRIPGDVLSMNGKTRLAAPVHPTLVVGSLAVFTPFGGASAYAAVRDEFLDALAGWLDHDDAVFVFHNLAFDFHVINEASGRVGSALRAALAEGRVFDTMGREMLIQIAEGRRTFAASQVRVPSLAKLAERRLGLTLQKDEEIRCGFDKYIGKREDEIPLQFLEYAAMDAYATAAVFLAQEPVMAMLHNAAGEESMFPLDPKSIEKYGYLSEHIQAKGAVVLRWLEGFPLRVDLEEVKRRRSEIWDEFQALQERLISYSWARRAPRTRKFHLSLKAIREVLACWCKDHAATPPLTDSGLVATGYDDWTEILPRNDPSLIADDSIEGRLHAWLRYGKLQKLMSTYIDCYGAGPAHYTKYWNLITRTTRTSSVRPNVQNIPKHRDSLRALFVPAPGYKLVEFDFKAAELAALAQILYLMFGHSALRDDINAGRDPHVETAKRMVGKKAWDAADADERKRYRQMAKAFNFGIPGGLGAVKLQRYAARSYKVQLTISETKQAKADFLEANPELKEYLRDGVDWQNAFAVAAENLGLSTDRLASALNAIDESSGEIHPGIAMQRLRSWSRGDARYDVPVPEGFRPMFDLFRTTSVAPCGVVRGRASYTEAHNLPFQATVACALKLGLWLLYERWEAFDRQWWRPVCEVHDSILIEVRDGAPKGLIPALAEHFRRGLQELLPDVVAGVDVEGPKERWGVQK